MASYQVLSAPQGGLGESIGEGLSGMLQVFLNKKKEDARKEKINKYIASLGDDYNLEVTGFDENGDPEYSAKKKESSLSKDPSRVIKEALLFDENIPEVGKKMGLVEQAQGFPVAGGGAALPGPSGGEYMPGTMQTVKTPGFADIVRQSLLEKVAPGMNPDEAKREIFGTDVEQKEEVPESLAKDLDAIFTGPEIDEAGNDRIMKLKALYPKYTNNKAALDRIKYMIGLVD